MSEYTSYYLYQRYEKRGDQPWLPSYPNTLSIDGDGTMPLVVKEEDDPQCGYVPPLTPIYEWRLVSGYLCDECGSTQYRWYTISTFCDGNDLYAHQKKQYSSDGVTWIDVSPSETQDIIIEYDSDDCQEPTPTQYRWYPSGTTCIDYDKWQNNIKQQSTDGGETWENVSPPEYSASTVIEYNSEDCGYVIGTKWFVTYTGGTTSSAQCDSSSAITSGEISTHSAVTSVQIGDCVTSIGYKALSNCRSLTSVTIGSGVTSIGTNAFYYCTSLTSVIIPNSVTSIGNSAFYECRSLTSITIPNSVTSISEWAFGSCSGLTSVTIGSGVITIATSAFQYCSGLTSVTIGSGVTSIGDAAFSNCRSLTSITIPSGVTSLGQAAFYGCSGLTSVIVEAITPPSLDRYAFYGSSCPIYVPAESVSAYQSARNWSSLASRIQPLPST